MNYSYIEQLLARYWEAETTQQEEQILRSFFMQEEVPTHLQQYAPYFSALGAAREQRLGEDFDKRLLKRAGVEEAPIVVKAHPITLADRVRPYLNAAAVVAVVALVGGSISYSIVQGEEQRDARLADQSIKIDSIKRHQQILINTDNALPTAMIDTALITAPK